MCTLFPFNIIQSCFGLVHVPSLYAFYVNRSGIVTYDMLRKIHTEKSV